MLKQEISMSDEINRIYSDMV